MRTVTKFQSDGIIYELTEYDQNKSVRAGDVRRTGGAANSYTILFGVWNDTTGYFKLRKTRRTPPECISGLSIQINFDISRGKPAAERMRRPLLTCTGYVTKVESVSATTEDTRCAT